MLKAVRPLGQRLEWYERLRKEAGDAFINRICGSTIFTDKKAVCIMGFEQAEFLGCCQMQLLSRNGATKQ
jgi:hypothetical protein